MPRYPYRCELGHDTEVLRRMTDEHPEQVTCGHEIIACPTLGRVAATVFPSPEDVIPVESTVCGAIAHRVWGAPAAIHFHGPGFYSTDVKSRVERRRRPNPGDDLARTHDHAAAAIAADA